MISSVIRDWTAILCGLVLLLGTRHCGYAIKRTRQL